MHLPHSDHPDKPKMAVFGHFRVCLTSACLLPAYPRFVPALWMTTLSNKTGGQADLLIQRVW
jgi:hypothetical protein